MMNHETSLQQSWYDSAWVPLLNPSNVMDYFTQPTNPFYDRQCNNEMIRMQRLNPDQMVTMQGLEYILLHVQEPILYIIRAQMRHSLNQVTPVADYYIIAGVVYQAPDLSSIVNSRLLNAVHGIESAFEEAQSFSRYNPSKGYWWEFKDQQSTEKQMGKEKKKKKEEPSSHFQRQRVDQLLLDLAQRFPPKILTQPPQEKKEEVKAELKAEVKHEKSSDRSTNSQSTSSKQPAEKKAKLR